MRRQRATQLIQHGEEALAAGHVGDARRSYQVALALVPGLAQARGGLERVARAEAQGVAQTAPAVALSEEAAAWYEQGVAAMAHQDWTEAVAALRQAVALAPDFPDAGLRLTEAEQALTAAEAEPPAMPSSGSGTTATAMPGGGAVLVPVGGVRAPGDVLLADHFGSAEFGCLPVASPEPARYRLEYRWGQYAIVLNGPAAPRPAWVPVPGSYTDAGLVVDAQVLGDGATAEVQLCCRSQDAPDSGYQLHVAPAAGWFALYRCDAGRLVALADWQESAALRRDRPNRLELSAAGATVTVTINGLRLAAVRDETYASGGIWIGASAPDGRAAEIVLAGFQVVQR
jgi:tetratricopeptide (TPR) repeat protein